MRLIIFLALFLVGMISCQSLNKSPEDYSGDLLIPVGLKNIKVGGEIGRRLDVTVSNNLLRLNIDEDFLKSFREKSDAGYIGLGKLIDATVKMAANTGDNRVDSLRNYLVREIIKAQETDGYIGNMSPGNRMWKLWDIHEIGYIIFGLITDYNLFGNTSSLEAAEKAAGYIIRNWSSMPAGWENSTDVATHVAITGIHRTMLALNNATDKKDYRNFCIDQLDIKNQEPVIIIGRRKLIEGHIYAYMALSLAKLELYREE
jgi:hypothetical protein